MNEIKKDLLNETPTVESNEDTVSRKVEKQIYYETKAEALSMRKRGDRIYYDALKKVYYIRHPHKRNFWGF